jgi:hypothetical protein
MLGGGEFAEGIKPLTPNVGQLLFEASPAARNQERYTLAFSTSRRKARPLRHEAKAAGTMLWRASDKHSHYNLPGRRTNAPV